MSQDVCNGRCVGHASEFSASEWKPDPACPLHGTGQQPAQPGSGEAVLVRFGLQWNGPREFVSTPMVDGYWTPWHIAQSALTAAQCENAALRNLAANLQPGPISEALSGQRYTTETELRDQLTAAQQRTAALHAALRTYGWHKPERDYMQEELPCTCGFLTAVERGFPEGA